MRRGQNIGKYKIRRLIGSGAFSSVYEARDRVQQVNVALKIPRSDRDADDLLDEVRLVCRLDHPNILPVLNADYVRDLLVVAQPLGRENLHQRRKRGLPADQAELLARQMLAGLAHAHERGVVHRDVKPDNMVLFDGGVLRLGDFGAARDASSRTSSSMTGTVGYLAPEQAMGKPTARSDVFSAALVIHELLTGELPQWPFDRPLPGQAAIDGRSGLLSVVLHQALSVDERVRFENAGDFLEAFDAACRAAHAA